MSTLTTGGVFVEPMPVAPEGPESPRGRCRPCPGVPLEPVTPVGPVASELPCRRRGRCRPTGPRAGRAGVARRPVLAGGPYRLSPRSRRSPRSCRRRRVEGGSVELIGRSRRRRRIRGPSRSRRPRRSGAIVGYETCAVAVAEMPSAPTSTPPGPKVSVSLWSVVTPSRTIGTVTSTSPPSVTAWGWPNSLVRQATRAESRLSLLPARRSAAQSR